MAAASTLQYGRPKKSVYGKSKSTWDTNFFDDSDDELTAPTSAPRPKPTTQRSTSVKASYPVQKTEVRNKTSPQAVNPRTVKQDTFDVPSSEEESPPAPKAVRRPAFRTQRPLVDDRAEAQSQLAPWERESPSTQKAKNGAVWQKNRASAVKSRSQTSAGKPIDQKHGGSLLHDHGTPASDDSTRNTSNDRANLSSASARLAARKRVAEPAAPSADESTKGGSRARMAMKTASGESPRKRAKTTSTSQGSSVDVVMEDHSGVPLCDSSDNGVANGDIDVSVYDFPESSADESSKPRKRATSNKVTKAPARRGKLNGSSARTTPRKGVSAPARLAEMLPSDSDITEPSTASPSASVSRGATPQQPTTPPSNKMSSPHTAIKSRGNITPKQAQLWNRLLPAQPVAPSPSALAMKDLTISGRTTIRPSVAKRLVKSQSDVARRRTRLVDRLKASAQSSSEDESDASISEAEDTDMADASDAAPSKPPLLRSESTQTRTEPTSGSQSQNRSQSTAGSGTAGLKRTYASQRSHLAEDNPEDDLMAGLLDETPKQTVARPTTFGRQHSNTKRDAFDLDDSDDEASGTGGIRTIHELRAAGRNIRGTEDIEQILEDIENHNVSHKSRRRSALIELVTQLADKNFASRFIGQGCDTRLVRQCHAPTDEVASFVLATAVALLLASDPPEHTLRTLQDGDVASWLGGLLSSTSQISKVAMGRRSNMARASQNSLVELAKLVRSQQSLWSEEQPTAMSSRLVALKALDLLIGKLRRLGDKTELLDASHLPFILPATQPQHTDDTDLDTSLSISVLESLSTASLDLSWPPPLITNIASTLTSPRTTASPTATQNHTLFLTLRLTLNLTTSHARNSDLLASTAPFLLQTVLTAFAALDQPTPPAAEAAIDDSTLDTPADRARALTLDRLVLSLGILINLFESSTAARTLTTSLPSLPPLLAIFVAGQHFTLEAASVDQSISNVALGYLAVALANLCQDAAPRGIVRKGLPGGRLGVLGDAVEEFWGVHRRVDGEFAGEEGGRVWGGFTEGLMRVLVRVRGFEAEEEEG